MSVPSGWLYAFVVEEKVMYVGLTERILRSRMDDYRHIKGEQTIRMRELISAKLKANRDVLVYGRREYDSDTLWAEEAKLRRMLDPAWNRC